MHKFYWCLSLLLATTPSFLYAKMFSDYCPYTEGQQDCSEQFMLALDDSSNEGIIEFAAGQSFRLNHIHYRGNGRVGLSIIGHPEGDAYPQIFSDRFYILDVSQLHVSGLRVAGISIAVGDQVQSTSLVRFGGVVGDTADLVEGIVINDNVIEDSAEDLLSVINARDVTVTSNVFRRSGLAMRTAPVIEGSSPSDLRPAGSGILFSNVEDVSVTDNQIYEIKKNGIYFSSPDLITRDVDVSRNYVDLQSYSLPTLRYGLKGGAGIYFDQTENFSGLQIRENSIHNFKMNAVRVNGENIVVANNAINSSLVEAQRGCYLKSSYSGDIGAIAIKGHYLSRVVVENNCVQHASVGVSLESWRRIDDVTLFGNTILDAISAIVVEYKYGGQWSDVDVVSNVMMGSSMNAIAMRSLVPVTGVSIVGNTISNGNPNIATTTSRHQYVPKRASGPLIFLQNQVGVYFDNNYVFGLIGSINWNHLVLDRVANSRFIRSAFISPRDPLNAYSGIYIKAGSNDNRFERNRFDGPNPGIHNYGVDNSFH